WSEPSGARILKRKAPPTLKSCSQDGSENPSGPHQFFTCSGRVQASNTNSRGASKIRSTTRTRGSAPSFMPISAIRVCLLPKRQKIADTAVTQIQSQPQHYAQVYGKHRVGKERILDANIGRNRPAEISGQ